MSLALRGAEVRSLNSANAIPASGSSTLDEQVQVPEHNGYANEDAVVGGSSWFDTLNSAADETSSTECSSTTSDEDAANPAVAEAMVDVEDILDQLIRLGLAIRKSGTNARLRKADSSFKEDDYQDLQRYLTLALLIQGGKLPGNQENSPDGGLAHLDIAPYQLSPQQNHLIAANLRRRHRFVYARRHQRKLQGSLHINIVQDTKRATRSPNTAKSATPSQAAAKTNELQQLKGEDHAREPIPTITTASAVEGDVLKPAPVFSRAASGVSMTTAKLGYPAPPPVTEGVNSFKCPCCYQTLPIMFKENTRWRYPCPRFPQGLAV